MLSSTCRPLLLILEPRARSPRSSKPRGRPSRAHPKHPVALAIAAELGPPSSQHGRRHGESPDPDPHEVDRMFPGLALVLDAGAGGTVPTSVVDLSGPNRISSVARATFGFRVPLFQ